MTYTNCNTHTRPAWLKQRIDFRKIRKLKVFFKSLALHTVCENALCPNITSCFEKGIATFMILGDMCMRNCTFCAVEKGNPLSPDEDEPRKVAEAVKELGLKYVVITSVTRDDIPDGGAGQFVRTIECIRLIDSQIRIEVLTPDFRGNKESISRVVSGGPDVFNHNVETVPRLYPVIRSHADYQRSLHVLKSVKELDNKIYTKSGLILGMGETQQEVLKVLRDLREYGCDMVTLGQYLSPSAQHCPVYEYIKPSKFAEYKKIAKDMGFLSVASGPYVRSSYQAEEYYGTIC